MGTCRCMMGWTDFHFVMPLFLTSWFGSSLPLINKILTLQSFFWPLKCQPHSMPNLSKRLSIISNCKCIWPIATVVKRYRSGPVYIMSELRNIGPPPTKYDRIRCLQLPVGFQVGQVSLWCPEGEKKMKSFFREMLSKNKHYHNFAFISILKVQIFADVLTTLMNNILKLL